MYENCICINFVKRWVFFFVVQDILVVISNQQKEKSSDFIYYFTYKCRCNKKKRISPTGTVIFYSPNTNLRAHLNKKISISTKILYN